MKNKSDESPDQTLEEAVKLLTEAVKLLREGRVIVNCNGSRVFSAGHSSWLQRADDFVKDASKTVNEAR